MFNNLTSRQILWLAVIVAVVLIVGLSGAWYFKQQNQVSTGGSQSPLIGGDKDAGGCLTGAGYSWCEAKKACIRVWETYCTAAAPKTAVFDCAGGKAVTATFYPADDKYVDLDLGNGEKLTLPRAISASGARYANAGEFFVFWNKGDTAFITKDGVEIFKDCVTKD